MGQPRRVAFNDFKKAVTDLISTDALQAGTIWKCTEKQPTVNRHLTLAGKLQDVIDLLRQHPWVARHYFRCSVKEKHGQAAICANLGFGKGHLPISPAQLGSQVVLYIREGTKEHVCAQSLAAFEADGRVPQDL